VEVEVTNPATANAGEDFSICDNESAVLFGSASFYSEIQWLTTGDGVFDDNTILEPVYTPGENDLVNGNVQLTLVSYPILPCIATVTDQVVISFNPTPEVTFDALPDMCVSDPPYLLTEGSPEGGFYEGTGVIDNYFYPQIAGVGEHLLTYSYTDENLCSSSAEEIVKVDECTDIAQYDHGLALKIIPNPNDGRFNLLIASSITSNCDLKIFSSYGQVIFEKTLFLINGNNNTIINLDKINRGIYLLQIKNENSMIIKKVLIY
jgi:hypothetical protein